MINQTEKEIKIINSTLESFEKSLKCIEKDSLDAFALVIFINACNDTSSYPRNRYSALVHYQQARKSATILVALESRNLFGDAIKAAHRITRISNIVHPDFML